jgi:hypothetical protein
MTKTTSDDQPFQSPCSSHGLYNRYRSRDKFGSNTWSYTTDNLTLILQEPALIRIIFAPQGACSFAQNKNINKKPGRVHCNSALAQNAHAACKAVPGTLQWPSMQYWAESIQIDTIDGYNRRDGP